MTDHLPDEERRHEPWPELCARLSRLSVDRGHDAYAAVDWDAPEHRIAHDDPRWELPDDEGGLGATRWYRSLAPARRARLGLHVICASMKVGWQFEHVLERGLLEFVATLPDGAPEARYAYHEIIEESQHSLMFQEFVRRAGLPAPGLRGAARLGGERVARLGRTFPELFFVFVLGGEDPIDHVQRRVLKTRRDVHPLLRRIMQIHVAEEARHLCFARELLRQRVPALSARRRAALSVAAPAILAAMTRLMLRPSPFLVRTYGIPDEVVAEAYERCPRHRRRTIESLAKVRALCVELGIHRPSLWRALGIEGGRAAEVA